MTSDTARPAAGAPDGYYEPGAILVPPSRRTFLQQVVHDALQPLTARLGLVWIATLAFLACFAPLIASSHPIVLKSDSVWSSPMLRHLTAVDVALIAAFVAGVVLLAWQRLSAGAALLTLLLVTMAAYLSAGWPEVRDALVWCGERTGRLALWLIDGLRNRKPEAVLYALLVVVGTVVVLGVLFLAFLRVAMPLLPWRTLGRALLVISPLLLVLAVFPRRPPVNVVYERYRELQQEGRVQAVLRAPIPYSPTDRLRDRASNRLQAPSLTHVCGTDNYGADALSRIVHGTRIALAIGFIATGISVILGIIIGGVMGYYAGAVDLIGMRLIEIFDAIPRLVLLIVLTVAWGRNIYLMMVVIGLTIWTGNARFVRAEFLKLRKLDFVQAATAAGLPTSSILLRHMLPNGIAPVLVSASFGVASAILMESTLSFLGLGLVDEASWGEMLNQARSGGAGFSWWIATFPGLAIFLTVFAYNMVGEAIRDALDPRLLKRE